MGRCGRAEREENIRKLQEDTSSGEDELTRLNRDTRELTQVNIRLKDDMQIAEEKVRSPPLPRLARL